MIRLGSSCARCRRGSAYKETNTRNQHVDGDKCSYNEPRRSDRALEFRPQAASIRRIALSDELVFPAVLDAQRHGRPSLKSRVELELQMADWPRVGDRREAREHRYIADHDVRLVTCQ